MQFEIDDYKIISKIFSGNNLKIVFRNNIDINDKKVLDLKDVAGFIETPEENKPVKILLVNPEGGSSYNTDLSIRLKLSKITNFPEVFLFTDKACVNFCFRAVAKSIDFRTWIDTDKWLP